MKKNKNNLVIPIIISLIANIGGIVCFLYSKFVKINIVEKTKDNNDKIKNRYSLMIDWMWTYD